MNPSMESSGDWPFRAPTPPDFRTTQYIDAPARSHTSISSLADDLAANLLTRDEAQRIAANIARLPRTSGEPRSRNDLRTLLAYCSASDFGPTSPRGAPRDKIYDPCSHRAR